MPNFPPLCRNFQVQFNYSLHFTRSVFDPENPLLAHTAAGGGGNQPGKLLLLVDDGLLAHHPKVIRQAQSYCRRHRHQVILSQDPLVLPGGEGVKNDPGLVALIHRRVNEAGLCRHSYLVALGGGALIDTAGYAAATAHRGIRLIRLPTTVMAQADASIGVKNSINAFGKKNFLGTFAPPWAVINDADFLPTLSPRDWLSGVAEAVKVALIKDADFFDYLEKSVPALVNRDLRQMQNVIYRCAALHLDHITGGGDPFESGSSRPLDFGHWAAHKLENLSGHQLRHGEAVALGMAVDVTYACLAGLLPVPDWQRILALLAALRLPVTSPWLAAVSEILLGLQEFREHLGGPLTIFLLRGIGRPVEVNEIDEKLMATVLTSLQEQDIAGILRSGPNCRRLKSGGLPARVYPGRRKISNPPFN